MKRRDFITTASLVAGASAVSAPAILSAQNRKPITIKFDSYVTETAGPSRLDDWFLRQLETRANGAVTVRRYWAQSLNKVGEHLSAVRDGTSEMSLISPGYYQAQLPVTRGLDWYYRMHRADALQQVCRDVYTQFQPLRDEWEKRYRVKVMYWTNWYYAPLVTRKPINTIEDIRGMRIRGYGVSNDVIQRLGGTAVPMAAPDVYSALERGVLDGVYGFDFLTAVAYKLHEIAPHFTEIGDGPHAPATVIINMRTWESFPEPIKALCNQIVDEIYTGKFAEIYENVARQYVKTSVAEGVKFAVLADAQKAKARALVQPAEVQAWLDNVAKPSNIDGAQMQALIDAAIAKYDGQGKLLRPDEIAAQG